MVLKTLTDSLFVGLVLIIYFHYNFHAETLHHFGQNV